jgi:hypothetical protein
MNVTYCDLCGNILKDENSATLYVSEAKSRDFQDTEAYYDYIKKVREESKQICPTCLRIFKKIFELRLQRLSELTEEINLIYNLKSIKNPKERRRGKEKK